jgi:hypothetical protein
LPRTTDSTSIRLRKLCGTLENPYKKWHDQYVIFLDDGFDGKDAEALLTAAGFIVERFPFKTADGKRKEGVKDPDIIRFCNARCYILLTTDGNIINRHRSEIEKAKHLG